MENLVSRCHIVDDDRIIGGDDNLQRGGRHNNYIAPVDSEALNGRHSLPSAPNGVICEQGLVVGHCRLDALIEAFYGLWRGALKQVQTRAVDHDVTAVHIIPLFSIGQWSIRRRCSEKLRT